MCNAKTCKGKGKNGQDVWRYLNTADMTSTSNLRWHAKICWGVETVTAASDTKDVHAAQAVLAKSNLQDRLITATFQRVGKENVTYSHRQHSRTESQYMSLQSQLPCLQCATSVEIVWWVFESMHPFKIVKDCQFQSLMKTGRPGYYIPSPQTVSHDVKQVFVRCWQRIAKMLQVCQNFDLLLITTQ